MIELNIDDIYDNIIVFGGGAEGEEMQYLIAKTIYRLPKNLWDKVMDEATFVCFNAIYGQYEYWSPSPVRSSKDFHFILLNLSSIEDDEEKMYVIAHETAHFILEHHGENLLVERNDIEAQADDLCEKWGFTIPERRRDK